MTRINSIFNLIEMKVKSDDPSQNIPTTVNEEILQRDYGVQESKSNNLFKDLGHYARKKYTPNKHNLIYLLYNIFPIIKWLPDYKFSEYFLKDLIGGVTLGIVLVPQTMAYSLNAGLPSYQGLYTLPIAMYTYLLMGTARHVALGIFGAVALLLKRITDELDGKIYSSHGVKSEDFISNDETTARILISSNIAFWAGIIQILFAITKFGTFFTKYLSDVIVIAYASATAFIILTTQIFTLLGIPKTGHNSQFEMIENVIKIFSNLHKTNPATMIISLICMLILYIVKHFLNERYKKKLAAPFPIEFLILISTVLLSYLFDFEKRWKVKIIGTIPTGYPAPVIPDRKFFPDLILPSFNIAIVSYSINVSIAKLFSRKYNYSFKPDNESLVYGLANVILSFLRGVPLTGGLSRCAILESIGIKTLMYNFYASSLILIVIFSVGPLLKTLPIAALASIISVSLLGLCREISQLRVIYKRNKTEGIAFAVTWFSVILFNVDYGLYISMFISLSMIIFQNQRAIASVMGNIPNTMIYEVIEFCKTAKEIEGIKIIRFESSIFYANIERFEHILKKMSGINPYIYINEMESVKKKYGELNSSNESKKNKFYYSFLFKRKVKPFDDPNKNVLEESSVQIESIAKNSTDDKNIIQSGLESELKSIKNKIKNKYIIIDLSCVNTIDNQSIMAIKKLNEAYKEIDVTLCFSYAKRSIIRAFNKSDLKSSLNYCFIYPTTHDAVVSILFENDKNFNFKNNSESKILTRINTIKRGGNLDDEISDAEDAIIEPKYTFDNDTNDPSEHNFDHLMENINK